LTNIVFALGTSSPGLDDERRDEHVDLGAHEPVHHVLEVALAHLPVADGHARARHDAPDVVRVRLDRLDAVVHEEHLPAAIELARDRLLEQPVVVLGLDEGEHRGAVARRRLHERHVAEPASDWCSVRGMGVAVSVSTSVSSLSCLSRSLCLTPKRCSSSTMISPSRWKSTSGLSSGACR
jgi:hypothetical protein